jgi:glycopeptide antibiotics resistance protein
MLKLFTLIDRKIYILLVIAILGAIIILSLYPFRFRVPVRGIGAVRKLLSSWSDALTPIDFVLNVLAYIPLGFCACMAVVNLGALARALVVVVAGATLSISFELAQYFIPGRFTDAADVYANTLGLLIGTASAVFLNEI